MILGLGSGSAVARFARVLGRQRKDDILVVPSSMQAWSLARENGLKLFEDSAHCPQELDICVDGADQISTSSRSMIKGGGGALLKEKVLLSSSKMSFILADETKFSSHLTRSVPVEVIPFSVLSVEKILVSKLRFRADLRKLEKGYPFFTESGNLILDCTPERGISHPLRSESELKMVPGVVEAGIFNCKVEGFYKVLPDGRFEVI